MRLLMRFSRSAVACLAAVCALTGPALAQQDYPNRPVRWILGFPPGGPTDIVVRLVAAQMSEKLGQQFVIENRAGAGGNLATQAVVNSAPDGYTILAISHSNAINATLYQKLPFNFTADIVPVAGLVQVPNVLVVNPSVPAKTVPEFIDYVKKNEGRLSYASSGNGTSAHLAAELFKTMAQVQMQHVPYRGSGPAVVDLLGGQVTVMFDALPSVMEQIKADKLRVIAVTTATPSVALPGVPTIAATVKGYELSGWFGVGAPKGTPPEIVARLNREVNAALNDPKVKARLADVGATPFVVTPDAMVKHIASEMDKWGAAVKFSGAKVD